MSSNHPGSTHSVVAEISELFRRHGGSQYGGEAVTQLEHALQAAWFARRDGADDALTVAALLHDVGHLLHDLPDDAPDRGIDDVHEERAAVWLGKLFGPEVVEPVRLHVAAKRYLCAVEPDYARQLSPPSLLSLKLQGGPMAEGEMARFRTSRHWEAAVRLRRYDDAAKVAGLTVPELAVYFSCIERAAEAFLERR